MSHLSVFNVRLVSEEQYWFAPDLMVVQHALEDTGALGQSPGIRAVHHKYEPVDLVVILGPDTAETFTAAQVVYGDMIALQWRTLLIWFYCRGMMGLRS